MVVDFVLCRSYNGEMVGEKVIIKCRCGVEFQDYVSNRRSGYCSLKCYWESKKGSKGYWYGKKRSFEDRKKMSQNRTGLTAKEKHPNWKGGISEENKNLRQSFEYKEWKRSVFKRDGWKCVLCSYRSKSKNDIEADHIKRFSDYPELRYEMSNGRTLCVPCHKKVTFGKI